MMKKNGKARKSRGQFKSERVLDIDEMMHINKEKNVYTF